MRRHRLLIAALAAWLVAILLLAVLIGQVLAAPKELAEATPTPGVNASIACVAAGKSSMAKWTVAMFTSEPQDFTLAIRLDNREVVSKTGGVGGQLVVLKDDLDLGVGSHQVGFSVTVGTYATATEKIIGCLYQIYLPVIDATP